MSVYITSTQINLLSKVSEIVKSNGLGFSGVYPTDSINVYIVSTWGDVTYQTVNAITREIRETKQSEFAAFVEGKR